MSLNIPSSGFIETLYNWFMIAALLTMFALVLNLEHYQTRVRLYALGRIMQKAHIEDLEKCRKPNK